MLKTELFNCGNVPIAIKRGGISKHYITNSDKGHYILFVML